MTKMLSASGGLRHPWLPDQGLCPWTPLGALLPDPRYRLVLRTRHGAPQPLIPSAAYVSNNSHNESNRINSKLKTSKVLNAANNDVSLFFGWDYAINKQEKNCMTTSESKGRFLLNKSIRITNRIESIRIANWNALGSRKWGVFLYVILTSVFYSVKSVFVFFCGTVWRIYVK